MRTVIRRRSVLAVAGLLVAVALSAAEPPRALRPALASLTGENLLPHIRVLASDAFEGRAPGTAGEEKTVGYLIEQFRAAGVRPGNPDGSWVQEVPLVGSTTFEPRTTFRTAARAIDLAYPNECVIWSKRQVPAVAVADSDVIFVGYGVVAPEYGWDDFKDVDVQGKTLIILINDPPVPLPGDPQKLDPAVFKGRAMTYYGRWTYKFEMAARKGAAAAIIVHEDGPAGYPWAVVEGSNSHEHFDLAAADGNASRAAIEGWVTFTHARELFAAGGFEFATLKARAVRRDFRPVPLGLKASFSLQNRLRKLRSRNVVARLDGADPKQRDEYVIYSAHWDHLGRDPRLPGDQIFHGAVDNASGCAALLELARAYAKLPTPPRRSVLFLSVTAEESGLLGSRYYAEHPLYPLTHTLADLNMDALNLWGRTADVEIIGQGNSTLETVLARAATGQRRVVRPESTPERGHFYRSDHFEFAKVGVPALYFKSGTNFVGRPAGYGMGKIEEYVAHDYHKVTDVVKPDWDFGGAAEDLQLIFQVGWQVAEDRKWPAWLPGSEFKARRDQSLAHP